MYGCETWTLPKKDISKIQASEMKFKRAVKGCSLRDHLRNDDIRKEKDLELQSKEYRQNWKSLYVHDNLQMVRILPGQSLIS